jgi:hypothetical protein
LRSLEGTGNTKYQDRSNMCWKIVREPAMTQIKRNKLALFKKHQPKVQTNQDKTIKVLQYNVTLFGELYMSMQNRDGDLKEFFAHEIQSFPVALSDFGKLHLPGTQSELLKCVDSLDNSSLLTAKCWMGQSLSTVFPQPASSHSMTTQIQCLSREATAACNFKARCHFKARCRMGHVHS